MFKVNNRITRTTIEICSKLTVNCLYCYCEHISHLFLIFLSLTLSRYMPAGKILKQLIWSQPAQQRYDNVVTTSLLTLSQRGTVENESCADVGFRRRDNVALLPYQDVATTLLQRRDNIKHWISRPFYYGLFWFLSLHQNVRDLPKC